MNARVMIIAEAGVNHNGSLETARSLIDAACDAGADFVKFQTFRAEKLVSKNARKAAYQQKNMADTGSTQFDMLRKLELSEDDHFKLRDYANQRRIKFFSTAFDEDGLDFLYALGIAIFKIPSGEITNLPYLKKIASKKKPTILSTGMATLGEIESALAVLLTNGLQRNQITVLHCNTEYPTPFSDVNLKAMNTIAQAFHVKVGYSDHTTGIEVPIAAVALGATCIEKHFTLSRDMEGPDHKASLEPEELKAMVTAIRNIEKAISGSGLKEPSPSEIKNKEVARKSIHLKKDLPQGHILREADLIMKRPGNGISPMNIPMVLGKKVSQDLPSDTMLAFNHLS
ncbi:N-acetylneuraminate synthase [Chryseolinea sp. H1M3-3]|uniref:N-acetylneuraminate synthase n=1 Tax=Chryseolinea sp. H1M3-3 TaxID=3034144 RepID=UPI0023EE0B6E|nr:N-acetylneuraminate synthase [Chryseolinea sp. H1M3-3]